MHLKSRSLLSGLWWTALVALILGLVASESSSSSSDIGSESAAERAPRKYLELDDLNAFESADEPARYSSDEELVEQLHVRDGTVRPKRNSNATSQQPQSQRLARQSQKKQRPGFFWTLARVTFETFNDTKSAIQQIGGIINDSIAPESTRKPAKKKPATRPPPSQSESLTGNGTATSTAEPPSTTTEFKLTRPELQSLVRRNVKGLVRLFNIEWRDAIDQSKLNVQEFHRDLGKQVGMYLQDNPENY